MPMVGSPVPDSDIADAAMHRRLDNDEPCESRLKQSFEHCRVLANSVTLKFALQF